jgi:iron(III) transport system ATP-binding protein
MRVEIKDLQMRLKCTSIYVTHDQAEAMVLGDRIILLDSGKIRQQGKPMELYQLPNSRFSAFFFGITNLLSGKVKAVEPNSQTLILNSSLGKEIRIRRTSIPIADFRVGDDVYVSVRGGSMNVFGNPPAGPGNFFQGRVEKAIYLGDFFDYEIKVGDVVLRAQGNPDQKFDVNDKVYVGFGEEASGVCCFKEA